MEGTAQIINEPTSVEDVFSLQAKITTQQSLIKQLKKDGADTEQLTIENEKLGELRARLTDLENASISTTQAFNRKGFDELILRKMYVVPSFEIHNGPAGLFDVSTYYTSTIILQIYLVVIE